MTVILIEADAVGIFPKGLEESLKKFENRKRRLSRPQYVKSPGDQRRLAVTQAPIKKPPANAGEKKSQERK